MDVCSGDKKKTFFTRCSWCLCPTSPPTATTKVSIYGLHNVVAVFYSCANISIRVTQCIAKSSVQSMDTRLEIYPTMLLLHLYAETVVLFLQYACSNILFVPWSKKKGSVLIDWVLMVFMYQEHEAIKYLCFNLSHHCLNISGYNVKNFMIILGFYVIILTSVCKHTRRKEKTGLMITL